MKILLVGKNNENREIIKYNLMEHDYEIIETNGVKKGLRIAKIKFPDIIITDAILDDGYGIDLCKTIRKNKDQYGDVIIIMISEVKSEACLLKAFKAGVDEFIRKPFPVEELILRMEVILKRVGKKSKESKTYKSLKIDFERKEVFDGDQKLDLTSKQYNLLEYLIYNKGIILKREKIMLHVWNRQYTVGERVVDAMISKLRKKSKVLEDSIKTVKGFGYTIK